MGFENAVSRDFLISSSEVMSSESVLFLVRSILLSTQLLLISPYVHNHEVVRSGGV